MKYLRQAKKNGKLALILTGMSMTAGLGMALTAVTVYEVAVYGELQTLVAPLDEMAAVANSPAGRGLLGVFLMYIGFFAIPRWSQYTQIQEEYTVRVEGAVDSVEAFCNVRKMTVEERQAYAGKKQKENAATAFFMVLCSLIFAMPAVKILSLLPVRMSFWEKALVFLSGSFFLLMFLVLIIMAFFLKMQKYRILKRDCFVAVGYSYSKSRERVDDGEAYYVKVWDGESVYLERQFEISREEFERAGTLRLELCFYREKDGSLEVDIMSETLS